MKHRFFSSGLSPLSQTTSISQAEGKLYIWLLQISIFQDENPGQHRHSPTQWSHRVGPMAADRNRPQELWKAGSLCKSEQKSWTQARPEQSPAPGTPQPAAFSLPAELESQQWLLCLSTVWFSKQLSESLAENLFPKPKCKQGKYSWSENASKKWIGILPDWLWECQRWMLWPCGSHSCYTGGPILVCVHSNPLSNS